MPRPRRYTDAAIIAALIEAHAFVSIAARKLGCAATTIYNRAKISPAVRQCLLDEDAKIDDMAELKLYEKIMAGDMNAIKFRLSTKARHRGYGDKLEVEGEIISPVPMSEETKAELTRALAEAVLALQEEPDDDAEPDPDAGVDLRPGDDGADQERHGD